MDSWTTRRLFPAFGLIPIERAAARQAMAALGVAAAALEQGHVLGIYPEGTRSRDGLLHRGHTGVAQLALMTGASIVPVGLVGTDRIQPIGARLPRPFRRAEIRFGPPLDPASYGGSSRRRRHLLTSDLMDAIRQLSGRQTSDDFASDEPPLIRGGNESVYQVHRVTGQRSDVAPGREVRRQRGVRTPRRRPRRRGSPTSMPHRARRRGAPERRTDDLCEVPTGEGAITMNDSVYQVVELIGSSSDSWEFAAQNAVREASRSYKDLRVAEVVEMDVLIESGAIIAYRTKLRLSFKSGPRLTEPDRADRGLGGSAGVEPTNRPSTTIIERARRRAAARRTPRADGCTRSWLGVALPQGWSSAIAADEPGRGGSPHRAGAAPAMGGVGE